MVHFLLDNSLGAWWAARNLSEADLKNAGSEDELRNKAAIPGVPLEYLRFVRQEDGAWTPAAGTFDSWPEQLCDLKTLDPCCGSGHFLVAAFLMLVPMRMQRDGLSAPEAVDAVLTENIHGLELDQRCVELAAFALALSAWKYADAGGYRSLPEMHLACSGLPVSVAKEEWKQLGLGKKNLTIALDWMHDTFKHAPVLGSLLNPAKTDAAKVVQWDELSVALEQALEQEQSDEQQEVAVAAHGLAKAATLLAGQYQWVITNVPYLARGKQCETLRKFCEKHYPAAKNDLATVFLDRCLELCVEGGTTSVVLPQNWLFLISYRKFREKLLQNDTWNWIARLGPQAFQTPMWDFNVQLLTLSRGNPDRDTGGLFGKARTAQLIRGVDVSEPRTAAGKAAGLLTEEIKTVKQTSQLENPDARVALEESPEIELLGKIARTGTGVQTFDSPRFLSLLWERPDADEETYIACQTTVDESKPFGGGSQRLKWENGSGGLAMMMQDKEKFEDYKSGIWKAWQRFQGTKGVCVSLMRQLPVSLFSGSAFDNNTGVIIPNDENDLPAIWAFSESLQFNESVRKIDQKLNVTNATLVKIPFDVEYWSKVVTEKYPNGLPTPYSDDPTQWIFHGHPCGSVVWDEDTKWTSNGPLRTDDTVLQVTVARLLGYRWPAELDTDMELADEQRTWVDRCEPLLAHADDDGIVCLPAINRELPAHERLLGLLQAAWGDDWHPGVLNQLLEAAGCKGKSLEVWLQDKFFEQHCKLFQHRPFIWHVWDGLHDGFSALVNYHKLDKDTLDRLIFSYLGDWIRRQEAAVKAGEDGSEERLAAARGLKTRLEAIKAGEVPLDIFIRWKAIEDQAIGWNPDLNDGVRLNIRPFLTVDDVARKGAGLLRWKPNIHWKKDRGKDVASAPWFPVFGGDRINDHHLSLAEKKAARAARDKAE